MSVKMCRHYGSHDGYITNQPGEYDPNRSLASRAVCSRKECRDATAAWVEEETGDRAVYKKFGAKT